MPHCSSRASGRTGRSAPALSRRRSAVGSPRQPGEESTARRLRSTRSRPVPSCRSPRRLQHPMGHTVSARSPQVCIGCGSQLPVSETCGIRTGRPSPTRSRSNSVRVRRPMRSTSHSLVSRGWCRVGCSATTLRARSSRSRSPRVRLVGLTSPTALRSSRPPNSTRPDHSHLANSQHHRRISWWSPSQASPPRSCHSISVRARRRPRSRCFSVAETVVSRERWWMRSVSRSPGLM